MPGLYGIGANVTVNSSNTTGLYAISNTASIVTGNVVSVNTTGLYIGQGNPAVLSSAQQLLTILDNNGNVNFALDSLTANTTVKAYFVGSMGSTYSNANVAAFLPIYNGVIGASQIQDNTNNALNLASTNYVQLQYDPTGIYNESEIQDGSWAYISGDGFFFQSNVTGDFKNIQLNNAGDIIVDGGIYSVNGYFWANGDPYSSGGSGTYSNVNVAAYLLTNTGNISAGYFIGDGSKLTNLPSGTFYSNANVAAYLPTYTGSLDLSSSIIALYSNAASQAVDINTLFGSQTLLQNEIVAANVNIQRLDANLGAFETYANLHFGTSTYSNANVAAYLPTYTGTLDQSSTIIDLYSNAASQATSINTLFANAASQQVQIDDLTTNAASQAADINTLFANAASQAIDINTLFGSQTVLQNEITAANVNIQNLNANIGAFELYANANAASQATAINTINANVTAANVNIQSISANLGAFETYANLHFGDSNYSNVNVAAFLPTYTGTLALSSTIIDLYSNAASQQTQINTLNANVGAFEIYANANIGAIFNHINTLDANVGAYEINNNANVGAIFNHINTLDANVGAFETYANTTFGPGGTGFYSNANAAAYLPTYSGSLENSSSIINLWSNAASQQTQINTLNANVGAFENYANLTFGPSAAGFYSNANVAGYLPTYTGNIAATVTQSLQPYIKTIGANNNNSVTNIFGGNGVIISANAGPTYSNAGQIIMTAGNTQVAQSGTFGIEAHNISFIGHVGYDSSDYLYSAMPTAIIGTGYPTSYYLGANIFTVSNGNAYIGSAGDPNKGRLTVDNKIVTGQNGVVIDGNTITTVGYIVAGGNVTAPYFIGDGSKLTNVATSFGNTQIAQYLPAYTGNIGNVNMNTGRRYIYSGNVDVIANGNTIDGIINIAAGNATASSSGYINILAEYVGIGSTGPGSQIQNYATTYITENNPTTTSNVLQITGNIKVASAASSGYVYGKQFAATGNVIAGSYFIGDGSLLTGITVSTTYGNSNVAAYLPTYTGTLALSSTIVDLYSNAATQATSINTLTSNAGSQQTQIDTLTSNAASQQTQIDTNTSGLATLNANVGAFETYANATFVASAGTYGNANVAAYLPTYSGTVGDGTASFSGRTFGTAADNMTISAATGTMNITTTSTNASMSLTAKTTATIQGTTGLTLQTSTAGSNISLSPSSTGFVNVTAGKFRSTGNVEVIGGKYFIGDGSLLTNVASGYGNTQVAQYLPVYNGALAASTITATTVNAATIGNTGASLVGTISTAAQTNITSVGTLASLSTSGTMSFGGNAEFNSNYISNSILQTTREKTYAQGNQTGVLTINANVGPIQTMTLTGNIVMNTNSMSNFGTGQTVTVVMTQDATGSRLLTSNLKYAGGSKVLSTAASSIDTITITYDGTNYLAALVKGYV